MDVFSPEKTCLGNSLSSLASLPDAIRKMQDLSIKEKHNGSAPREVMRLVGWLMTNATAEVLSFVHELREVH